MNAGPFQPKLISGDPSSTDEFKGGAHGRVAQALANLLISGTGGRAIGLEGSWGSGKSTVIDIASEKISAHDASTKTKHVVFIFDTWAHQGDPILRVFLDELIVALDKEKAVDRVVWDEKLQRIRSRTKKTIETKSEKLTWPAKIAVLMIPLWPLAFVLLARYPSWVWVALALLAVPYISVGIAWLCWNHVHKDGKWFVPKDGKQGRSVLWAFTKQTDQSVVDQLIREEEATTIEFNRIFDDLIEDARKHSCKVIIILDNLDRLPSGLIREVWATMRNFFASAPGSERHDVLQNVRLVVPFDRTHIENVFDEARSQSSTTGYTPGFIEKTFEIVLRVSPPLLSNWRVYLRSKMTDALGNIISEQQAYNIFKLFDLDKAAKQSHVTPREIISYVNSIVSQYQQWDDEIPVEYQALYVLNRSALARDIKPLQNATLLDTRTAAYVSDWEWTKYLAAAHFNVSPNQALEILLATEISEALVNGDIKSLTNLQTNQGFEEILDVVVMDNAKSWAADEPKNFIFVAAGIDLLELKDETIKEEVWSKLCSATAAISKSLEDDIELKDGLVALSTRASSKYKKMVAGRLASALTIESAEPESVDARFANGAAFFSLVEAIGIAVKPHITAEEYKTIFSNLRLGGSAHRVFGAANASSTSKELAFEAFRPMATKDQVSPILLDIANSAEIPLWFIGTARGLLRRAGYVDWAPIRDAVKSRLQTNKLGKPATTKQMLEFLKLLPDTPFKSKAILAELINDGSIQAVVGLSYKAGDTDLVSRALYEIIAIKKGDLAAQDHPHYGSLQEYRDFAESFKKTPEQFQEIFDKLSDLFLPSVDIILDLAQEGKENELYRKLFRDIIQKQKYTALPVEAVARHFSKIRDILGDTLADKFATRFADWDIEKYLPKEKWYLISPNYLATSYHLKTKHIPTLLGGIRTIFSDTPSARWLEVLRDEEEPIDLLFEMQRLGEKVEIDTALFDALQRHTELVISDESFPSETYESLWQRLPAMLNPTWEKKFFVWLRDRLVQHSLDAETILRVLSLFGTPFAEKAVLLDRPGEVVSDIIDPLLAANDNDSLKWLEENAARLRDLIANSSERAIVTARLNISFATADGDVQKNRIENLAMALGAELSRPDEEKNSEEEAGSAPAA